MEAVKQLEDELIKEETLEKKRMLQKGWKAKKEHHQRIKWAKEWLSNQVLDNTIEIGGNLVENRLAGLVVDIVNMSVDEAELKSSRRMERMIRVAIKKFQLKRRQTQRQKAEEQRSIHMRNLESWWTFLESGMPDLQDPTPGQQEVRGVKRKRKSSRRQKRKMMTWQEERRIGLEMASGMVDRISELVGIHHDCMPSLVLCYEGRI